MKTHPEAKRLLTRLQNQVDEDRHPKSNITVRQAIAQWLDVAELENTTCSDAPRCRHVARRSSTRYRRTTLSAPAMLRRRNPGHGAAGPLSGLQVWSPRARPLHTSTGSGADERRSAQGAPRRAWRPGRRRGRAGCRAESGHRTARGMDEEVVRAALRHYIHYSAAGDENRASEIYHEDAVVEFPQSGERFEGVENFREWRRIYPAKVELEILRVRAGPTSGSRKCGVATTMDRGTTAPPSMSFAATRCPARRSTSGRHGRLRSGVPGGEPRLPVSQRAASPGSRRRTRAVPNGSAGRVLVRVRSPPPFGLPERAQPDRKAGHRSTRSSCANRSAAPVPAQLVRIGLGAGTRRTPRSSPIATPRASTARRTRASRSSDSRSGNTSRLLGRLPAAIGAPATSATSATSATVAGRRRAG